MLARLEKPHAATIRIGPRVFDLLVTPLTELGARRGFVVEWSDARYRLQNLDYAAQIAAIHRYQSSVEFDTQGNILDANENFLNRLGYRLEEVKGRHHSLFVFPEEVEQPGYKAMWDDLRAGTYRATRFRRRAKDGTPVWIDGAYNPILDEKGKVAKVVKFATDATSQVALLADLGQIVRDLDAASNQTAAAAGRLGSGAGSARETVHSLASSSAEVAAAGEEIARTMTTCRDATETAFDQAVKVGDSAEKLATATRAMSGVVELIRTIASQINLLALNATIEAARAGEAGKGFAVVASEVKNLAVQAAKATGQITSEIEGIQATSTSVAASVVAITGSMSTVRESVNSTASAVEQQNGVSRAMADGMRSVSDSVASMVIGIEEIEAATARVAEAVERTRTAAEVLTR